jgi:chromate reductase
MIKVAVIVGSTRPGRKALDVARWVMDAAARRSDAVYELVDIQDFNLPLLDEPVPPSMGQYSQPHTLAWARKIAQYDGFVFVTPEYNRSVPAALKNAIDVGSRPYGKAAWTGKPCAIVSQSPGALGGFGANHHLRQTLPFLNMPAMPAPEAYLGGIATKFEGDQLTDDSLRGFLQTFVDAFAAWVEKHAG